MSKKPTKKAPSAPKNPTVATPSKKAPAVANPPAGDGVPAPAKPNRTGGIAADQLQSYVERIERLEEEKSGLAADIKDIYTEVKSAGFDTKIVRKVVRRRRMAAEQRREEDQLLELYERSIEGMFG